MSLITDTAQDHKYQEQGYTAIYPEEKIEVKPFRFLGIYQQL